MSYTPKIGLSQIVSLLVEKPLLEFEWAKSKDFDPNLLLDALRRKMQLENDVALARKLLVIQPIIRMIREGKLSMTPAMLLLWVQESTGITLPELRRMMEDYRADYRAN